MLPKRPVRVILARLWAVVLLGNMPREISSTKPNITASGFPFVFAVWREDRWQEFELTNLLIDLSLPVVITVVLLVLNMERRRTD